MDGVKGKKILFCLQAVGSSDENDFSSRRCHLLFCGAHNCSLNVTGLLGKTWFSNSWECYQVLKTRIFWLRWNYECYVITCSSLATFFNMFDNYIQLSQSQTTATVRTFRIPSHKLADLKHERHETSFLSYSCWSVRKYDCVKTKTAKCHLCQRCTGIFVPSVCYVTELALSLNRVTAEMENAIQAEPRSDLE